METDLSQDAAFRAELADERFAEGCFALLNNRTFYRGQDERGCLIGWRQAAYFIADLRGRGESYLDYLRADRGLWPNERESFERKTRDLEERMRPFRQALGIAEPVGGPSALDEVDIEIVLRIEAHFARLGWRVENEEDRARKYKQTLDRRIAVLREIEVLEIRPAMETPDWASSVAEPLHSLAHYTDWTPKAEVDRMNPDERQATPRWKQLENRLHKLSLSGRISREEYEALRLKLVQAPL